MTPDGKSIVFDLLGDIYTMPITGGKATPLTQGMAFDGQPRYSPDGKKITFVSDRDGGWNIFTMSLDKKDTVQITRGKTNDYQSPEFTPDGKYIVAARGTKLWIYHTDGGTGQALIRRDAAGGRGGAAGADVMREIGPAFGKDPRRDGVRPVRREARLSDLDPDDAALGARLRTRPECRRPRDRVEAAGHGRCRQRKLSSRCNGQARLRLRSGKAAQTRCHLLFAQRLSARAL